MRNSRHLEPPFAANDRSSPRVLRRGGHRWFVRRKYEPCWRGRRQSHDRNRASGPRLV